MEAIKVLIIYGTRPEYIKLAPVIKRLKATKINVITVYTQQHKLDMMRPLFDFFGCRPDVSLTRPKKYDLIRMSSSLLTMLKQLFQAHNPDYIIVQGDTTTAMIRALRAFYKKIKIRHVQAGLRTNDKSSPFPEQVNRRIISQVADVHFAPTKRRYQFLSYSYPKSKVMFTGNTVVDAVQFASAKIGQVQQTNSVLVTMHRRQNFGKPLENVCKAIKKLAQSGYQYIIPVHPNPAVKTMIEAQLNDSKNVKLIKPLSYPQLIRMMKRRKFVMTDSGGIQQQAPSLGKYVFVLRNDTQRMQSVQRGMSELVGTKTDVIVQKVSKYKPVNNKWMNPYGDGHARQKIARHFDEVFQV